MASLLVSPDFLDSDFIHSEELSRLLARRERDGIRVVPIIVRPCHADLKRRGSQTVSRAKPVFGDRRGVADVVEKFPRPAHASEWALCDDIRVNRLGHRVRFEQERIGFRRAGR